MTPHDQFRLLTEHSYPRKTALWYYRLANVVWLWIAFAIALGFVQWRVEPEAAQSAFDLQEHATWALWTFHLLGLASGIWLGIGIWRFWPRAEILGHCLLAAFIALNAVAVADLDKVGISFVITVSIAFASAFRVYYLVKFSPQLRGPV